MNLFRKTRLENLMYYFIWNSTDIIKKKTLIVDVDDGA